MTEGSSADKEQPSAARRFVMRWPAQLFILPVFYGLVLFLAAGDLDWLWGWIFAGFYLLSSLLILLTVRDPALIAEREDPPAVHLIGLAGLTGTAVLGTWSMRANTYFSAFVRIQADREQTVVDQGPYRIIRHPGNLSMILWALGTALTLGSVWALLPAAWASALVVRRTVLEDGALQEGLAGYRGYAGRVRYRLLPGIW